jgi:2-iminobutanoate/2-iminopropanoate deaminase
MTSGTPGLSICGDLPKDITAQAELAWEHVRHMMGSANMAMTDIVKVTQYLTRAEDIPAYEQVRARFLNGVRPTSMLLVIPQLMRADFLVEVEVVAAKRQA